MRRVRTLLATALVGGLVAVLAPGVALAQPSCTDWQGSYFDNTALTGAPVATRCDPAVNFDWSNSGPGVGSPPIAAGAPYSVSWTRSQTFDAGVYTFRASADDGIRVRLDGTLIVDSWQDRTSPASFTASPTLTAGAHTIVVEYYHNTGPAFVRLEIDQGPPPPPTCTADQWTASYFPNTDLSGTPWVQCENAIDHDWGLGGPSGVGVGVDDFSTRWTKTATFDAGTLSLQSRADDGVRVLVDGVAAIDRWIDEGPTAYTAEVPVTAGSHTITVEYYEHGGGAVAQASYVFTPATSGQPLSCPGRWSAAYYANTGLSGAPAGQQCENAIDYDWGTGGPSGVGVGVDNFSARWTRTDTFAAGTLTLQSRTDDGVRVLVDGVAAIDRWIDQGPTVYTASVSVTAGPHTITVEYYERLAGAVAQVSYVFTPASATPPLSCPAGQWSASYFANAGLQGGPSGQRCEAAIDNDWGTGGPTGVGVGVDNFSVRWVRSVTVPAGTLTLSSTTDDGVRVYVDGVPAIDKWVDEGPTAYTAQVPVTAGSHTLTVEYYEHGGGAVARFSYTAPAGPVCPSTQWLASYFPDKDLSGNPVVERCEDVISYDWGAAGPGVPGIGVSNYSVRWTKSDTFDAGHVGFSATADDGVRVYLDGAPAIDQWRDQGATTFTANVPVTAGAHTITVEYYQGGGGAVIRSSYTPLPDQQPLPPPPPGGCTSDCAGSWTVQSYPSPVRSIHATVLHTGEVLLIAGSGNNGTAFAAGDFKAAVWNPGSGTFDAIPTPIDLFCTGHTQLADGRILLGGGTAAYPTPTTNFFGAAGSFVFDPATHGFTRVDDMPGGGHWYPSLVNLGNGDVFATGGLNETGSGNVSVEMFGGASGQWRPISQTQQTYWYWGLYPVMILMNDGRLFYSGVHTFGDALPNTSGSEIYDINTGVITEVPGLRDINFRDQGGSLLLPPAQAQKVMDLGGGNSYSNVDPTAHTDIIDLNGPTPTWVPGPDLPTGKMYVSAVTLPDGKVLETGGGLHNRVDAVHEASIYDPSANTMTSAAADPEDRMYHSEAFLLPDGRVAALGNNPTDGSFGLSISVYSPWYMTRTRPSIDAAPTAATYGSTQNITVTGDIGRAVLIRPASVTHQSDPNQRSVDLALAGAGANLSVQIPNNRNLLPPGYYMLFVQDKSGVPSIAKWVNIQ